MYRNRLFVFLTLSFSIFLCIPLVNLVSRQFFMPSSNWPKDVREMWSLDITESLTSLLLIYCCDKSTDPDRVEIGQDGYFFLGNSFSSVMDRTTGKGMETSDLISAKIETISRLQDNITRRGAIFAVSIAPNKHSIYPEVLPKERTPADQTPADIFAARAAERGLNILDLRPPLRALKTETDLQVYLRTDSHWSDAGGAMAYTRTIDFLKSEFELNLHTVKYDLIPIHHPAGDLARLLKTDQFLSLDHELDYDVRFDETTICLGEKDLKFETRVNCVPHGNMKIQELGRDETVYFTQAIEAPNPQTVLMLCDSFCASASALFNATFKSVHSVHWELLRGQNLQEYLDLLAPDIVILQIVERKILSGSYGLE